MVGTLLSQWQPYSFRQDLQLLHTSEGALPEAEVQSLREKLYRAEDLATLAGLSPQVLLNVQSRIVHLSLF